MMPKQLSKRLLAGASLAAALAVLSPSASATLTGVPPSGLNDASTVYAAQGIPAGGTVTIPSGLPATVLFFESCPFSSVLGGTALITFTLPAGVTFTTVPTLTPFLFFATATPSGVTIGSNQLIVSVTYPAATPVGSQGVVVLGPFEVSGASALATSAAFTTAPLVPPALTPGETALSYTAFASAAVNAVPSASTSPNCSVTGPAIALGQTGPFSGILATSLNALGQAGTPIASGGPVINVAAPGNAMKFNEKVLGETNGVLADVGSLLISTAVLSNSTASGTFNFGGTTSGTVTLTGNFQGISSALLLAAGTSFGSCPATNTGASGAVSGTPTGNTLALTGVTIPAGTLGMTDSHELCVYATGMQIIAPSNAPIPVTPASGTVPAALSFGIATSLGGGSAFGTATVSGYTYNGTVAIVLYSQSNLINPCFIRIVNPNLIPAVVNAAVTADGPLTGAGSFGISPVETSLAAQNNDVVPVATIVANATPAITLPSVNFGRVSIVLLGAQSGLGFSNLSYAPGTSTLVEIH